MIRIIEYLVDLMNKKVLVLSQTDVDQFIECVPSKLAILPTFKFSVNEFDFELKPENYLQLTLPFKNPDEKQLCKLMLKYD